MSESVAGICSGSAEPTAAVPNVGEGTGCRGFMSSWADSRARTSAQPVGEQGSGGSNQGCGRNTDGSFATYDPITSSWRTAQISLLMATELTCFSGSWPRSGTTRSGIAYPSVPLVPRTKEIGSGLWPTLLDDRKGGRCVPDLSELSGRTITTTDRTTGKKRKVQLSLKSALALFPTLTARDASGRAYQYNDATKTTATLTLAGTLRMLPTLIKRDSRSFLGAQRAPNSLGSEPLVVALGGALNPRWCEWFMGFPNAWCDVRSSTQRKSVASGTRSVRSSRNGSRAASSTRKGGKRERSASPKGRRPDHVR